MATEYDTKIARPWVDLGLIALLWVVAVLLINPVGNFPINDDWTYKVIVDRILKDGSFAFPSSGATANVIVQTYWGALFCLLLGPGYTALRISSLTLALFGLWAAYGTAREVGARRSVALVAAATLGVAPLYLPMASSFMTDVPFTNLVGIAVYCMARGMRREDRRFVILGFAVALGSILHRQFGLLLVIAFGMAQVAHKRGSLRSILLFIGVTILGAAIHMGFQRWLILTHRTAVVVIGSATDFGPGLDPKKWGIAIANFLVLLPYLGVMLLPLYCATGFASARAFIRDKPWIARGIAVLIVILQLVAAWNREKYFPGYGNNLTERGLGPTLLYDRWLLDINHPAAPFPHALWTMLFIAGTVGVAAILLDLAGAATRLGRGFFAKRWEGQPWVDGLVLTNMLLYGLLVCMMTVKPSAFDRYMLPFIPPMMLLILAYNDHTCRWTKERIAATAALLAAFGAFSIVATGDYLAWHRTRWAATDILAAMGVPPTKIDGGYEYNGSHFYMEKITADWSKPFQRSWWWVHDDEYVIGGGPVPGYRIIRSLPYYRTLNRDWDRVTILQRLPGGRGEIGNYKPPVAK